MMSDAPAFANTIFSDAPVGMMARDHRKTATAAEGVETQEQLRFLESLGGVIGQLLLSASP
ncbi:hypothetical protein DCO57_08470 [Labrenzia sp. 011]|nr:hypothetical protein DCO57_08470 [Labrenzia sp. 011]